MPVVAAQAPQLRSQPLDFSYRVQGAAVAVGMVFDDGQHVFIQPADGALLSRVRVEGVPSAVQGPYIVVRGLVNRATLALEGGDGRRTTLEYTGPERPETVARECVQARPGTEARVTLPFAAGALRTDPGGLDQWPRLIAQARGADRVTIVAFADRPQSTIAQRRSARVRELLLAAGVPAEAIEQRVQSPAASGVEVISRRHAVAGCETSGRMSDPALQPVGVPVSARLVGVLPAADGGADAQPQPGADAPRPTDPGAENVALAEIDDAMSLPAATVSPAPTDAPAPHGPAAAAVAPVRAEVWSAEAEAGPPLQLHFLPNLSVQATLRRYLRAHGFDVEFRAMPTLMVEEFAEVRGSDLRDVLRRALSRLGLRGEIQGNRLLVVELAH